MRTLPASVIIEKNKLASADPFLLFFDVHTPDDIFYLVRNTEDVTRDGQLYTAFPIELGISEEGSKSDVPYLEIRVSNVTRVLQPYIEELEGMNDNCYVVIRAVNAAHLDDVAIELTYDILTTNCDDQWITFTLGASSPFRQAFPDGRYIADFCEWLPGGDECGVAAAAGVCNRTLAACRSYGNSANFGGNVGLSNPSVRLV